jgi:hypothetical protein
MFTIQDLTDGKCAVKHDSGLEKLRKVLKLAFPNDFSTIHGITTYYYASKAKGVWWCEDVTTLPFQSVKDFLVDDLKKERNMDNKFPFKLPKYNALRIIDIACPTWKIKLAKIWGPDIVLNEPIYIEKKFYDEMRKACTQKQHELFDEIFGKDAEECPYEDGELIWVKDTRSTNTWCLRYSTGKLDANGYAICYLEQRTSGDTNRWFPHQKAPGITLPK